jgi:hypothetical protein
VDKREKHIFICILSEIFPVLSNSNNYQKTKKSRTCALDLGDYEKEKF